MKIVSQRQETIDCPYCHAVLDRDVLSCRYCSRDLTPILPLLSRITNLENRFSDLEALLKSENPGPSLLPPPSSRPANENVVSNRRRLWPLPVGFVALLSAYATVVLWLDLSLSVLRFSSIIIPFVTGFLYLGSRYRLQWIDGLVAILFSCLSVFTMNVILGLVDSIPILPQDTAAWRETMYYMLSIAASMVSGMLLLMSVMTLGARGMTSLPRLRQGLLTVNKSMPLDMLKAIELVILLLGTLMSAIAGLFAGIMGLSG